MNLETLTFIGEVILVPVLTLITMWVKNSNAKDIRRDTREDGFIAQLGERVSTCEKRHADRDKEIAEIRTELKNRDAEYLKLYQEHTTIKAKYEVLQTDHNILKQNYDLTVTELTQLKEAIQADRQKTASLATSTAEALTP